MKNGIGAVQAASMLLAGILAGLKFQISFMLCCMLFIIGLAGGIFYYIRGKDFVLDQPPKKLSRLFFCLAFIAAGMGRASLQSPVQSDRAVENYAGQKIEGITGYIIAPPVKTSSRTTIRVQVSKDQYSPDIPNEGKLLLVFFRKLNTDFHYGDRLSISGNLILPPNSGNGFSYRTYLERDGITCMINNPNVELLPGFSGSHLRAGIYQLRNILLNRVYRLFPKPESALMAGILLGDESQIPSEIERDFQKTSTSHIIAISGANFSLLLLILLSIVRRAVPRWWSPLLILPFIAFYTILVGENSAVIRAAIMCALGVLGSVIGRTGYGINNLALTAAIMCFWKPVMIFDLGFQLSAASTLGILLFSEPLCSLIRGVINRLFPKISEEALNTSVTVLNDLCLMSISAQIFTMWISAQAFGRISLISLPANIMIAPFQSMIMLGGFAAMLLSFVFYPLGTAAAWLVWLAPALTIRIVQLCAKISWGSVYSDLSPLQAWLVIAVILILWVEKQVISDSIRRRRYQPYAALLLFFASVMIWANVADRLNNRTEIELHQTASSMLLSIRSSGNSILVIGDGMTNYAAQDALERQLLPVKRIPEAAVIDIPEAWMRREFLASDSANGLSVFYLNGKSQRTGTNTPLELKPGTCFSIDDLKIKLAASFLEKRAWIVENNEFRLLFPNGVPPERIFTMYGPEKRGLSLIVFGKRDNKDIWQDYTAAVLDISDLTDTTIILKDKSVYYR